VSDLKVNVQVIKSGCFGMCTMGPIVKVLPEGILYVNMDPDKAKRVISEHIIKGNEIEEYQFREEDGVILQDFDRRKFYQKQFRIVLRNCGIIDPDSIEEYIARDGYIALEKVLFDMSPEEVIRELQTAQLRGRGGAGFPTWLKWKLTMEAEGEPKYVVCNADEGDPGAYMDRSTLEGDPFSIIEAMTIAGRTIGAGEGDIYSRAE
jgi:(2Fe-2S) ferredoxin